MVCPDVSHGGKSPSRTYNLSPRLYCCWQGLWRTTFAKACEGQCFRRDERPQTGGEETQRAELPHEPHFQFVVRKNRKKQLLSCDRVGSVYQFSIYFLNFTQQPALCRWDDNMCIQHFLWWRAACTYTCMCAHVHFSDNYGPCMSKFN